jgi:hypothetical protein
VLRVGGSENDERLPLEAAHDVGAEQPRHLYVEKNELWLQAIDFLHRFFAVRRFPHHFHPLERGEHRAKPCPRDRLVVYYQRSDLHTSFLRGTTSTAS